MQTKDYNTNYVVNIIYICKLIEIYEGIIGNIMNIVLLDNFNTTSLPELQYLFAIGKENV